VTQQPATITNIQALRALAALAVVFYHTDFRLWNNLHTDFQGVAVFFVISGFIVPRISQTTAVAFAVHRFIRIVPMYWLATYAAIVLPRLLSPVAKAGLLIALSACIVPIEPKLLQKLQTNVGERFTRRYARLLPSITWIAIACLGMIALKKTVSQGPHFIKSLLFIPEVNPDGSLLFPSLGVGWTLNIEMFFYTVFGFALLISRRFAPLIVAGVLLLLQYLRSRNLCDGYLCLWYAHPYTVYFIYGIMLHYALAISERSTLGSAGRAPVSIGGILGALFVALNVLPDNIECGFGMSTLHLRHFAPILLVLAALVLHRGHARCHWQPILLLGNASYSLYLTHGIVIETFTGLARHFPTLAVQGLPGMVAVMVFSTAIAVAVHRLVELPMLNSLRHRLVSGQV